MKGFPESDLMQLFEEGVGSSPVHIKIVDNPNRGQGLAFVKFATPEEAKKVRERRTDTSMEGVTGRPMIPAYERRPWCAMWCTAVVKAQDKKSFEFSTNGACRAPSDVVKTKTKSCSMFEKRKGIGAVMLCVAWPYAVLSKRTGFLSVAASTVVL